MYLLAVVGVLTSVIGAFYYIRFIKIMYFEEVKRDFLHRLVECLGVRNHHIVHCILLYQHRCYC